MSNCHKEFLESYRDYPSQDNEGHVPDRGGYKAGFYMAWRKQDERIKQLEGLLRLACYLFSKSRARSNWPTKTWNEERDLFYKDTDKALGEDR